MLEEYKELFFGWFSEQSSENSSASQMLETAKAFVINSFNDSMSFISTHQNVIIALVVGFVIGLMYANRNKKNK